MVSLKVQTFMEAVFCHPQSMKSAFSTGETADLFCWPTSGLVRVFSR